MNTQISKAYSDAKKTLDEKQIKQFKDIILKTLEKLEEKQKFQRDIVKEIQILKADIKDFKEGRLDRIEERNKKDVFAQKVSLVEIKRKENEENISYYQISYDWISNNGTTTGGVWTTGFCKNNTSGTYTLNSGNIKYI